MPTKLRPLAAAIATACALATSACGGRPAQTATIPHPSFPTATTIHQVPAAPVKGLADNPSFQWWRLPTGPQPDSWWGADQTAASLAAQAQLMRSLGARLFRVELVWAFVEPAEPGGTHYDSELARDSNWIGYDWRRWDLIVDTAAAAGLEVVPEVYYTPAWAGGVQVTINGGPNAAPASASYYGDFMYALASRYRGRVHYWELWNEPDYGARAWNGTLELYVQLILAPGYQGVKMADPKALVVLGGLAGDTHMTAMYRAGAGSYFDIASFHAYYTAGAGISTAYDHVRGAMNANGDAAKPIWLTEFGLATQAADVPGKPSQPSVALEAAQARLIHDVYTGVKADAIFYYELRDTVVYGVSGPVKYVYWGLINRDLTEPKPGLVAFRNAASSDPIP